jgi:hypothetical protein
MPSCPDWLTGTERGQAARPEIRATPRDVVRLPCDNDRWNCFETRQGPTRGRSASRACQLASSWSRNDHEDGGPTIPLPAAEARCTLRSLSCVQYTRLKPGARMAHTSSLPPEQRVVGPGSHISLRAKAVTVHLTWLLSTFTRSALRIPAPNGRPFATSPFRSSRVRFSDSLPERCRQEHDAERADPAVGWLRRQGRRLGQGSACLG